MLGLKYKGIIIKSNGRHQLKLKIYRISYHKFNISIMASNCNMPYKCINMIHINQGNRTLKTHAATLCIDKAFYIRLSLNVQPQRRNIEVKNSLKTIASLQH